MTDETLEDFNSELSDEMYDEMHENGTFSAMERWPDKTRTNEWNDAYSRYQAAQEESVSEEERQKLTAELVERENAQAPKEEPTEEE